MQWPPIIDVSLTSFIIYVLACVGVHRLWNYESVFEKTRDALQAFNDRHSQILTFITCPMCNAFWIAVLLIFVQSFPGGSFCLLPFAAYSILRSVIWWYINDWRFLPTGKKAEAPAPYIPPPALAPTLVHAPSALSPPTSDYVPPAEPVFTLNRDCATCDLTEINKVAEIAKPYERRVVLLTTLCNFHPAYSPTTCILAQARMLAENPGWLVLVWVNDSCDMALAPTDLPSNVKLQRVFPTVAWKDNEVIVADMNRIYTRLQQLLHALGTATVISHDILFVHSYTTAAAAIHQLGPIPGISWLHTCHSNAGDRPAIIDETTRWQHTLPDGHRLLCLSDGDAPFLARYYGTELSRVDVLPNAYDIAVFGQFSPRVTQIIRDYELDLADVVQIYPISGTRMRDKGLEKVIRIFALLHNLDLDVRLIVANPHSNGQNEIESVQAFKAYAREQGLPEKAVAFTSEIYPDTAAFGLSKRDIHDLFSISNLFVFPTISEASSLVLFEAALSGCLLVLNESLHTLPPQLHRAISVAFGGCRSKEDGVDYTTLSYLIANRLTFETNVSKRAVLKHFSHRTIGARLRQLVTRAPPVH